MMAVRIPAGIRTYDSYCENGAEKSKGPAFGRAFAPVLHQSLSRIRTPRRPHHWSPAAQAQRAAVARFAESEHFQLLLEYVEAETGKGADALDRLSRDV